MPRWSRLSGTYIIGTTNSDSIVFLGKLEELSIFNAGSNRYSHLAALPFGIRGARRGSELLVEDNFLQIVCPDAGISNVSHRSMMRVWWGLEYSRHASISRASVILYQLVSPGM